MTAFQYLNDFMIPCEVLYLVEKRPKSLDLEDLV